MLRAAAFLIDPCDLQNANRTDRFPKPLDKPAQQVYTCSATSYHYFFFLRAGAVFEKRLGRFNRCGSGGWGLITHTTPINLTFPKRLEINEDNFFGC
jgi:hypothetical protein